MRRGIVALVFRCRMITETLRPSAEVLDVRWLTPQELDDCMTEAYRVRLLDTLDDHGTRVRPHDGTHLLVEQQMTP